MIVKREIITKPEVEVKEVNAHITDSLFAEKAAEMLCEPPAKQKNRVVRLLPPWLVSGRPTTDAGFGPR
jgi:hypothetical protein